ncbi:MULTISPECIES: deoxyribose-phosphate aldolase [unclassified Arsukibacterium]|uniref:deoxyribose-phosphate aldolase n=1 Tax=unclassified Arsukibacterium TaxID=2635278 RepID=UPI000C385A12|nr:MULTISPECIES: deoxyribose-phosphate aldolase [unclassified Arsukibacterium]MAA94759.1 deoxyribose-phosphate aldolase [Rheinheimera sp.]MBM33883.1 deoxyribose-phosphate aldolase [Rheinheimera sp.]HAW93746.1 deoxyribose-phosphate aldolase [Candidatus Azambacteria bacterium]
MTNRLRLLQLSKLLDVTRLNDADDTQQMAQWLEQLPQLPVAVAAYCVYPSYLTQVSLVSSESEQPSNLATVVNFPDGNASLEVVCQQIDEALSAGASEIDCVIPYQALMRGEHQYVSTFLDGVRHACGAHCLKVIIESGELITAQQVAKATELAIEAGADFVKSSTGKVAVGITEEAARIMLTIIAAANRPVGFKASGGVRTVGQALQLIDLYEQITGITATSATMRIGASTLVSELAEQLAAC